MRLFLALDKTGINWEWVVSFARYAELGVVQARRHPSALRLVAPVRPVQQGRHIHSFLTVGYCALLQTTVPRFKVRSTTLQLSRGVRHQSLNGSEYFGGYRGL